jgi:hypothetical protein
MLRFFSTVHPVSFRLTISLSAALATLAYGADPFADRVVNFAGGASVGGGYGNVLTALGAPERFTGEGVFPSVVTPFNPAFGSDEIVSIGAGGWITLGFDEPIVDDVSNPFGLDLIIFGNAFFVDVDYPNGVVGGVFGASSGGLVEVSADGITWATITGVTPDSLFPTNGYVDLTDPYALTPGGVESDFTKPVNPAINLSGADFAQILAGYAGSGGGTGVDISSTGLLSVSFVRISAGTTAVQIDAVSDVAAVPSPSVLLSIAACAALSPRRRGFLIKLQPQSVL